MDLIDLIDTTLNELGDGVGLSRQALVNHVAGYSSAYSQSLNRGGHNILAYTDAQINDAIDVGLKKGDYIQPLGPNGLIAISVIVHHILMSTPDVYTPVCDVVSEVSDEYGYLYSAPDAQLNILQRIYLLVRAGYLEANDKLEVRRSPNVQEV